MCRYIKNELISSSLDSIPLKLFQIEAFKNKQNMR